MNMPMLTKDFVKALGRKRGEMNITAAELARQTEVSRYTIYNILSGRSDMVRTETLSKLNEWLYQRV
ncbi:helix-turn-helix domain-containing protein [Lacticaseibacillus paracasei]|uniref:helix-turn-helix domain-containing protein n=1 Tax=Lacticaseibacillus paracasei TaxID=1597 RepID=UPI002D7FDFA2|nr:helix-turn-helix transcriptional regulator [Lacticaseibacillus paracasei]